MRPEAYLDSRHDGAGLRDRPARSLPRTAPRSTYAVGRCALPDFRPVPFRGGRPVCRRGRLAPPPGHFGASFFTQPFTGRRKPAPRLIDLTPYGRERGGQGVSGTWGAGAPTGDRR